MRLIDALVSVAGLVIFGFVAYFGYQVYQEWAEPGSTSKKKGTKSKDDQGSRTVKEESDSDERGGVGGMERDRKDRGGRRTPPASEEDSGGGVDLNVGEVVGAVTGTTFIPSVIAAFQK